MFNVSSWIGYNDNDTIHLTPAAHRSINLENRTAPTPPQQHTQNHQHHQHHHFVTFSFLPNFEQLTMQRAFAKSVAVKSFSLAQRSSIISGQSMQTRRRIHSATVRNISSTTRLAVANELASLRLNGAIKGFEESTVRGWDLMADDDGG